MKKHMRYTAFALMLIMLITALSLTACSNTTPNGGDETTTSPAAAETTAEPEVTKSKYEIGDEIPATMTFNKEKIAFVSRDRDWVNDEITIEDDDGGLISTAVVKRTANVESRLDIVIDNTKLTGNAYAVSDVIRNQANTGHEYDIFANSMYSTIMYTAENIFADLKTISTLDLTRGYWSQGFNESASIGKGQYLCTGAAALSTYRFIFVTFFNTNMFAEKDDIPSLYETVNAHKWTIDYQMEICSRFWQDLDATQTTTEGDICGFISNPDMIGVDCYWSALKLPILTKDADNMLEWALDTERTVTAVEKLQKLFWNTEGMLNVKHKSNDAEQQDIAKLFSEGNAAMATLRIIEVEDEYLRDMKDTYGIVPLPMLDETQDDYCSYAHDQVTAFGIANTAPEDRREMLGAVLEVFASESYKTVTPAYYEVALKSKYANDPQSWEMLDLVTEKLYIDPGVLYTKKISSIHQCFRDLVGDNQTGVASRIKRLAQAAQMGVKTLNSDFEKLFAAS